MKKVFVLLCLLMFATMPVMANLQKGQTQSLKVLNRSVQPKLQTITQTLDSYYNEITKIIAKYKQNPDSIKTSEINKFGTACIEVHKNMLENYENNYFKPAYNEYRKYDNSMDYTTWLNTTALSELSLFYEFYTLTVNNLEDCQKIYTRSTFTNHIHS